MATRLSFAIPALALLLVAALPACNRDGALPKGRLLVIGIDGASPRLMTPMVDRGELPILTRLAAVGTYGHLRSEQPLQSPRLWNTIATGKHPREHGITTFVYLQDGQTHLYSSHHRKVPALWHILSEAGMSVEVVNWWNTHPPDVLNGAMVSDHFFADQLDMLQRIFLVKDDRDGAFVQPPELTELVVSASSDEHPLTHVPNPFEGEAALPPWVDRESLVRQYETDGDIVRVALALDRKLHPDALFVFLPGIDRVSHALWGNIERPELYPPELRPSEQDREGGARALYDYYRYTDALIGLLLEGRGKSDRVLIVSDHGFEAGRVLVTLTGKHEGEAATDGVVFASGPGIAAGTPVGGMSIYDVAPTLLAWMGLPVAKDMPGRPAHFLETPPLQQIASYDGTPVVRTAHADDGREARIVEHLRSLGYLEEAPGEPPPPGPHSGTEH